MGERIDIGEESEKGGRKMKSTTTSGERIRREWIDIEKRRAERGR